MSRVKASSYFNIIYIIVVLSLVISYSVSMGLEHDNNDFSDYVILWLFQSVLLYPYGRNSAVLPMRREQAYSAYLRAQKYMALLIIGSYLTIQVIKNYFNAIQVRYLDLLFSAEILFIICMLMLLISQTGWMFSKVAHNKIISGIVKGILFILYIVFATTALFFANYIVEGRYTLPTLVTIIGLLVSIGLYLVVDKCIYKTNIKAVLDYDYAPGNLPQAQKYSLLYYKALKHEERS